jgi:hypothetical protein
MCERINEEREDINLEITSQDDSLSPTTRLADFDHLSIYKRHHRPRPINPHSSPSSPSTNLIDILLSDHPICLNQLPSLPHFSPLLPLPSQKSSKSTPTTPNKKMSLRPDSLNARTRGASHIDFRTATTGVIGKAMRNELSQLVNTVQDPQTKKASLLPHTSISPLLIPISGVRYGNAVLFLSLHPLSCRACSGSRIVSQRYRFHASSDFCLTEPGTASSPLEKTRSYPTTPFRSPRTRPPSTS